MNLNLQPIRSWCQRNSLWFSLTRSDEYRKNNPYFNSYLISITIILKNPCTKRGFPRLWLTSMRVRRTAPYFNILIRQSDISDCKRGNAHNMHAIHTYSHMHTHTHILTHTHSFADTNSCHFEMFESMCTNNECCLVIPRGWLLFVVAIGTGITKVSYAVVSPSIQFCPAKVS